jgi:hypothetical protein
MFKKWVSLILLVQGCSAYAGPVLENFDWGPGVPGREAVAAGDRINGVRVQFGDAVFQDMKTDGGIFYNASGPGRGALLMKGLNNTVGFNYPVSGMTVIKTEGRFYPGDRNMCGFWLGVQSKGADNQLLNNQTTDRIAVQLNPAGAIIFRVIVGGVTNQAVATDGVMKFASGDLVKMELTINTAERIATVKVTGAGVGNVRVRTVQWPAGKQPDWSTVMINQTGNGQLLIDSIEAGVAVPIILG